MIEKYFEYLVIEGLKRIGKINDAKYLSRAKLEFDRIVEKKYINYFLIVRDFVKWAKDKNIMVGPGRGSAGGSLISYCLEITEVDPIEHGLLFSRFCSDARKDMPDIDLDFEDDKRDLIYKYIHEKYGSERTAKVITFSEWHARGALRDVGRIFNIPKAEIEKICKLCVVRSGGDARVSFCVSDTLEEFEQGKQFRSRYPLAAEIATKLEGHIRHRGVHAAGMVVTEHPLCNYIPAEKVGGEIVTAWDKGVIERFNLIKFDILGLKTLSLIHDVLKMLPEGTKLPGSLDDKKVYDTVFKTGDTLGVFQFECLAGETIIGFKQRIDEMKGWKSTLSLHGGTNVSKNQILAVKSSGKKLLFKVRTKSGREIKVSAEHPFLTESGWLPCKDLRVGMKVVAVKRSHDQETKEVLSMRQKANWENPIYRVEQARKAREALLSDQSFQAKSTATRKTKEYREKRRKIQTQLWKGVEYSKKQRTKMNSAIRSSKRFSKAIAESNRRRAGTKHWNWKGGISARRFDFDTEKEYFKSFAKARKKVLKRDGYKCKFCGINEKESWRKYHSFLETHHIKPVRAFILEGNYNFDAINDERNLVVLCKSCHVRCENGKIRAEI